MEPDTPVALGGSAPLVSARAVSELLTRSIDFLRQYRDTDLGSEERKNIVLAAEATLPGLVFETRVEPRKTLSKYWRTLRADHPFEFEGAVRLFLTVPHRPDIVQLSIFLSLLAEAGGALPDGLAFLALERLERLGAGNEWDSAVVALVAILTGDGAAVISLLERLRQVRPLRARALHGAARKIASWDPARMSTFFSLFAADMDIADAEDDGSLRDLLEDIIGRAGAFSVLSAICEVDPDRCKPLYRAAFAGGEALYRIFLKPVTASRQGLKSKVERFVTYGTERYDLQLFTRPRNHADWVSRVRAIVPIVQWIEIPADTPLSSRISETTPTTARRSRAKATPPPTRRPSYTEQAGKLLGISFMRAER